MTRRSRIEQRRRIYVGCEGASEQSYLRHLEFLFAEPFERIHLEKDVLNPGAGDPLALLQRASDPVRRNQRQRGDFTARLLFLDTDRIVGLTAARETNFNRIVREEGWLLLQQEPCHEAFSLQHLEDALHLRPATTREALRELERRWPDYVKGMPAMQLRTRLTVEAVRRVAAHHPDLARFLSLCGIEL